MVLENHDKVMNSGPIRKDGLAHKPTYICSNDKVLNNAIEVLQGDRQ
uniref:Uncharacterized protein n=1 Tax=Enterobacter cloacae TaxID=550 RepID=A0A6C0NEL3_ENTCL|nr:Hypothetical protein [Enterobacter cloacae]UFD96611.1 hypothetical protein [Klebsiella oxytoca]